MDKLKYLSQINLFEEMPMNELEEIDRISNMQPLKKGTTIFTPETNIQALYLLKQGQVRLYRMSENGKQFTVDILGDGNIFGETATFSLSEEQDYAEAMSDVYLCIIGKEEFENLIEQNPKLAIKLIEILSARLKDIYEISEQIALRDVRYRVLSLLLKLSEKFGKRSKEWQTIDVKITHHDIATMVGSSRETVSSIISQLKKEGIIKKTLVSMKINADRAMQELE